MEDIKKGMNKIFNLSIVTSVIIFVLGIFLFVEPDVIINMISIVFGGIILIPGITTLIDYFKNKYQPSLVTGVVTVIIGMILIINTKLVASILPFILGIFFIVNGINRMQYALELRKTNNGNYVASLIISILIILSGVLFVINPFGGALVITKVMGMFMIIYSVLDIVNSIIIKKEVNNVEKIIEAEVVEKKQ